MEKFLDDSNAPYEAVTAETARIWRVSRAIIIHLRRGFTYLYFSHVNRGDPSLNQSKLTPSSRPHLQYINHYLDQTKLFTRERWAGTVALFFLFSLRIIYAEGWYIVAYTLGIYLLNLFLTFLQPKFDPALEEDETLEGGGTLPTSSGQEFRPFIRRLPEFNFWRSSTAAIFAALVCAFIPFFDIPAYWPVLALYWLCLFTATSELFFFPASFFCCVALAQLLSFSPSWYRDDISNTYVSLIYPVRKQISHMIKYRYVPFTRGKTRYGSSSSRRDNLRAL